MTNIRVLQFLDSVGRGGAETQALDVCRNAASYGIDVTFAAAGSGAMETEFRDAGIDFVPLRRRLPLDLYLASQLRKVIKDRSIQLVHGYQAVEGVHLYMASRGLKNVRKVLSFQGFIPGRKNRIAARFIAPLMDANISVSISLLGHLRNDLKFPKLDNFHCIYNGADPNRLIPTSPTLRQDLGISEHSLVGGMVANFVSDPTKDQMTVCRALPKVIERIPNFHFVFAGRIADGAEGIFADCVKFCIDNEIVDNVHYLGARTDIPDILAELDLFVFSSRSEGFPVAVAEAMLAGVPMIVSDIPPLLEASDDGQCAAVFETGNADELASKMIELLRGEEMRSLLAARARLFATNNFSIDAHLEKLSELYRSLL